VIFCGINPASSAAAAGHHFLSPTNRFWRVLHLAGFTPSSIGPIGANEVERAADRNQSVDTFQLAPDRELAGEQGVERNHRSET
jgi:TDG/mug DNA glycosylase family protein